MLPPPRQDQRFEPGDMVAIGRGILQKAATIWPGAAAFCTSVGKTTTSTRGQRIASTRRISRRPPHPGL